MSTVNANFTFAHASLMCNPDEIRLQKCKGIKDKDPDPTFCDGVWGRERRMCGDPVDKFKSWWRLVLNPLSTNGPESRSMLVDEGRREGRVITG